MSNELRRLLKALDRKRFDVTRQNVTCWFGRTATVATARTLQALEQHGGDAHLWAWRRNRVSNLVGFRVDGQRRLLAETVLPHNRADTRRIHPVSERTCL